MDNKHNIDEIFAKVLNDHSIDPPASVWDKIQGRLDASLSGNEIDKVFENALSEHTVTPPAYVWDNIKGKLDAAEGKRRKRIGWILGSASMIIFSFVGGYFIANYGGMNTEEVQPSEKISNTHKVQIDVNHFWDLRSVTTFGESNSGGHTYTNTVPANTNGNGGDGSSIDESTTPRLAPNSASGEIEPLVPSQIQEKGRDDKGKKTDAVTSDVNGKVETLKGVNNSTNVAAKDDQKVLIDNNSTVLTDNNNNTNVEESRTEKVNPNDGTTLNNNENEKGDEPKNIKEEAPTTFTILPYFAPTYTARNSSMENMNGYQNAFGSDQNFKETPNFSYSAGVLVGYNFTPRLTVFVGAAFNTFSNTTTRDYIHSRSFDQIAPGDTSAYAVSSAGDMTGLNIVPTQGTPENPTYIQQDYLMNPSTKGSIQTVTQTFSYVEVPVLARYKFFGKRVGMTVTGGLSTGFIVQNEVSVATNSETRTFGETSQIRNFNMNAIIGVGVEVKITPFMFLNIEPTFKYSFLNWSMDPRFKVNPISLGLNTGLAFKF